MPGSDSVCIVFLVKIMCSYLIADIYACSPAVNGSVDVQIALRVLCSAASQHQGEYMSLLSAVFHSYLEHQACSVDILICFWLNVGVSFYT